MNHRNLGTEWVAAGWTLPWTAGWAALGFWQQIMGRWMQSTGQPAGGIVDPFSWLPRVEIQVAPAEADPGRGAVRLKIAMHLPAFPGFPESGETIFIDAAVRREGHHGSSAHDVAGIRLPPEALPAPEES